MDSIPYKKNMSIIGEGGSDYKLSCIPYKYTLGLGRVINQPQKLHHIVVCNPTAVKYIWHKCANSENTRNILVLVSILNNPISVSGKLV